MAAELDAPNDRVAQGVKSLLPHLIKGMRDAVARDGGGDVGVMALIALFNRMGDGGLAREVMAHQRVETDKGAELVDRIFDADQACEAVCRNAAASEDDIQDLNRILPLLAMLVAGYMSARVGGSGASGSGGPQSLGHLYEELVRP